MSAAVVTPPTVIPKTVTVESELVIETAAYMNAVGSLLSHLGYDDEAEWMHRPADKLERTAFNCVGVLREDDDPLVVTVQARSDELAVELLSLCGGSLRVVAESYRLSAQKIRESGTI